MTDHSDEIQKLLRQRGEQSPPEGFVDDFLKEFQSRQRSELLNHSARGLFFERLATYFSGFAMPFNTPRWAGAAAGACAITFLAVFFLRGDNAENLAGGTELAAQESAAAAAAELAEQRRSRVEFVAPVSLLFSEDLHPTRFSASPDHFLVEAEGPFSDLYILHPAGFAPDSRSAIFKDF